MYIGFGLRISKVEDVDVGLLFDLKLIDYSLTSTMLMYG